ncbi:hypothetical protein BK720_06645 [Bacillus thuringiensis serovar brasilensis]|uniref:Uncharacterized protein n=1 Tax=Bacillus fungorum TaxID=2039284 RepID=A0A2G6Q8F0_9BACI|nr:MULTISPECIES: hypothetical protein [Bacillus]MCU5032243.1 hypothetical protein [Bacillus cereus]MRA75336.1 hypothetical protein [Bacillus thuringiensis]MRA93839.1 hypothetical protein [Bacillus thuringiensis]MRC56559.1 hypothetical protein [Bacillus thuringiensis]OTX36639.1 hypothetical protein BK720_06645 [Bacillus thuringiensis serovar brasilensis]
MNKFMRELKAEELTKHSGGINPTNETVIHDGGGAGPNCKSLLNECLAKRPKSCILYNQFC